MIVTYFPFLFGRISFVCVQRAMKNALGYNYLFAMMHSSTCFYPSLNAFIS